MANHYHDMARAQAERVAPEEQPKMLALLAIANYLEASTELLFEMNSKLDTLIGAIENLED